MKVVEFDVATQEEVNDSSESLVLVDARTDVLGARLAFDTDAFEIARKAMGVASETKYRVILRSIDVTEKNDAKSVSYLFDKGSKFNTWKIILPVYDYLTFNEESIRLLNSYLYKSMRYSTQMRALIYLFRSPTLAQASFTASHPVMLRDAETHCKKLLDDGINSLLPSEQPTILDGWED